MRRKYLIQHPRPFGDGWGLSSVLRVELVVSLCCKRRNAGQRTSYAHLQ